MREFDKIEDCEGNIIQSGDTVCFKCKITNQITEGIIHHMMGGSFGLKDQGIEVFTSTMKSTFIKLKKNSYDN